MKKKSRFSQEDYSRDEEGAIIKKGKGLVKTALVYPNTYKAGMSSLGFQTVYRLANRIETVACERVFMPASDRKTGAVKSVETGLTLEKFDIILFSISFENDFINLAGILELAGIPLRSGNRNNARPLVCAGGVACFLNPEPIAPFIDCFLLGEAECLIDSFFDLYLRENSKKKLLEKIEKKLPGAYVPLLHPPASIPDKQESGRNQTRIKVQYTENLENLTTYTSVVSSYTAFKNTFLIEILKGCPHGCRFCSAGFIYRPPRIYPLKNIYRAIEKAREKTDKIGLVSSAVSDHPGITEICSYGIENGLRLSFSSLRADRLTEKFISNLSSLKVKTATIAPEAGSLRMRNIINKKITEDDILSATYRFVSSGIINIRLYFMIGLPFEEDEDVKEIVELTKNIKQVFLKASKKKKKIGTITLSINPFIPKPCTPFQWYPMAKKSVLKRRVEIIKKGLKKIPNLKMIFESLKKAKINALLSQGDRKTADIIESALANGWTGAIRTNKEYCDSVIYQEKPVDSALPWNILDNRVKKEFLANDFNKAKKEEKSPPCPMISCSKCKICI